MGGIYPLVRWWIDALSPSSRVQLRIHAPHGTREHQFLDYPNITLQTFFSWHAYADMCMHIN
jgi:hypothetical protein